MNADRMISMVIRMVMNRLLRGGVNAGINAVGNRMNRDKTPEQTGKAPNSDKAVKRTKQAMRVSRKIGRL